MSESIGKPWIESSVAEILVDHAHELPSPFKLQARAQIVKFLTFREDREDGGQPQDRDTVLWAEITDGEWIMPVRIANEATNKIEDEYKRALTFYRRGFFTLKAAVSFDFLPIQAGKITKMTLSKYLLLDIAELRYISGGGDGAPVATRGVALQEPPAFNKWVSALRTGGRTLTNLQAQERTVKDILRSSKANSRRSNATGASKRPVKGAIKAPAQSVTPQPSVGNLTAKREWQEGWFGKRPKFHGVDYVPRSHGFELTADQQSKLEAILERVKMATPTHPYDPTSVNGDSPALDRSGVPSTFRSSQAIRSSQVISSTPNDARLSRSNRVGSQLLMSEAANEPANPSSDFESDGEDSSSDHLAPIRPQQPQRQATNQTNKLVNPKCHIPTPRPSDSRVDENREEVSGEVSGGPQSLEADDAVTEQVLSQTIPSVSGTQGAAPTVLVPDSDPPNPSQRSTQVRYSSPWDSESELPSERGISHSPETTRRSPTKDKRRLSPTLSSPSRSILDASQDESMKSQPVGQMTNNAKQQVGSGQGESQPSAAASLPSPPPEDSNAQKANLQCLDPARRADETTSIAPNLPHPRDTSPQRNLNNGLSEQQGETFETRSRVDQSKSRKRRLSQSQGDDTPHTQLPQELPSSVVGKPITENKRRRLDDSSIPIHANKNAPRQSNIAREGPANKPAALSHATKTITPNNGAGVIPHDHDAWANPSWMNNAANPKQVNSAPRKALRISDVLPLDKPHTRRIPRPSTGLRILQPPFHYPTRIVERAPSPEFPPVTASQFADADEDFGVASSKVEPLTPVQSTNKPGASTSRMPNVVQSKHASKGQSTTSGLGAKQPLTSGKVAGNDGRVAQDCERTARNRERASGGQGQRTKGNQHFTAHSAPDNSLANSEGRLDNSAADTAQPVTNPTPRRPYLGGFQPSITGDPPRKYQLTWEKWLEVTKDAYSFWLE